MSKPSHVAETGGISNVEDRPSGPEHRPPGLVTAAPASSKRRPARSPLFRFYRSLQKKAIVDPLALLAFVLAFVPAVYAVYWYVVPADIAIDINEYITVKSDSYTLKDRNKKEIIRLTASFSFQNLHKQKKTKINKIEATINISGKQSHQIWSQFIHSHEQASNPDALEIVYKDNASRFMVSPDESKETEVYFAPSPGSKTNELSNAISKEDLTTLIQKGGEPKLHFRVYVGNDVTHDFCFLPQNKDSILTAIQNKGWSVTKWLRQPVCS